MTFKQKLLTGLLVLGLVSPAQAQVTIPNTLVSGTVIRASDLNTNFATLGSHSLDRLVGGTLSGNITMDPGVTIDGVDLSVALCSSCAATFGSLTVTGALSVNGNAFTNWVASVASGTGITSSVTSGAATATTISLNNTAVTPATYGSSSLIPVLTIDQQGRVTGATTANNAAGLLLLHQGHGTAFVSSSTVMDSFAVSGLTAFDAIKVVYTFNNPTGAFSATLLNSTDTVTVQTLNGVNSSWRTYELNIGVDGTNTKKVAALEYDFVGVAEGTGTQSTFTTDWTGTWTMALKSGAGITGSTSWTWRVYKLVGQ